ncbi:hypothetical protein J6590_031908 [Homalodisca vitripennis]|nr:hypothetical protein J6590_031908 [Homalodisca vitripennis]
MNSRTYRSVHCPVKSDDDPPSYPTPYQLPQHLAQTQTTLPRLFSMTHPLPPQTSPTSATDTDSPSALYDCIVFQVFKSQGPRPLTESQGGRSFCYGKNEPNYASLRFKIAIVNSRNGRRKGGRCLSLEKQYGIKGGVGPIIKPYTTCSPLAKLVAYHMLAFGVVKFSTLPNSCI